MIFKPSCGFANVFFRRSPTNEDHDKDILPSRSHTGRNFCTLRPANPRSLGYEDICRSRCGSLPCTKKYAKFVVIDWRFPANVETKQVIRDVKERGRDTEGCIKQWLSFVKPNFEKFVKPQRDHAGMQDLLAISRRWLTQTIHADIIVPRGIENGVAIDIIVEHIRQILKEKSRKHQEDLQKLVETVEDEPISKNVTVLADSTQTRGMNTIIQDAATSNVDFIFYFDRMSTLLVGR